MTGDLAAWRQRLGGIGDEAALGIAEQIAVHRELGWRHLELRTVDGIALADLPERRVAGLAGAIAEAGLTVPCLDSRIGNWARPVTGPFERDLAELDALGPAARLLGTRHIRVMSYPNDGLAEPDWRAEVMRRFTVLAARAEELDLVLLLENCSGWTGTSAGRARELLETVGSPRLAALFDIGNPVAHGYDGPDYLRQLLGFVRHVHVKDARPAGDAGDEPVFTAPGAGVAGLTGCLTTLLDNGYSGVFCVEPHVAVLPHTGRRADPATVRDRYLDYGHELERLLARELVESGSP